MEIQNKPKLSFGNIWNMNFGFFGIQFSFGLQQSNMSAIYSYLGANPEDLAALWLAGPVTGLVVQPIIGAISDGTWSPKFGRRKPFFLIGAILASIALIAMPFSSTIWMAAGLLWILDAANNIAMEPYRAFISDKLPKQQHSLGFLMQSFFTGLGTTMANFMPAILVSVGILTLSDKMGNGIPVFTYWAFGIGAFASIATVLFSVLTTKEYPPSEEELKKIEEEKGKGNLLGRTLIEIVEAMKEMPATMKQLIPVQFLTWFGMFCYWQYITLALSKSLYGTMDHSTDAFASAQLLTGEINGTYNIICFSVAFLLVPLARYMGAKRVHFLCLAIGGLGLIAMPFLNDTAVLFYIWNPFGETVAFTQIYLLSIGLGLTWASAMAMPYKLLVGAIPANKTGVYMGIFNMFIVIPMAIQIFMMQFFLFDLLGGDPIKVISLAGICLIGGGIFALFIKDSPKVNIDG
ncbi:MAG: MFS transporter [Reichenbachiella sp.]|uniref:MFS transporter n=1 Tax=Reichenbachiella sp. TaxID=2184521 RepID=UPI002967254B|nr:MFS transporter [Reichenbachiella sp.]MDW3209510.1 MFS transporter [Reichenbachiella sp.]